MSKSKKSARANILAFIFKSIVSIFTNAIIVRYLGSSLLGYLTLINSVFSVVSPIAIWGVSENLSLLFVQSHFKPNDVFKTALCIRACLGFIVYSLTAAWLFLHYDNEYKSIAVTLIYIFSLFQFFELFSVLIYKEQQGSRLAMVDLASSLPFSIASAILASLKFSYESIITFINLPLLVKHLATFLVSVQSFKIKNTYLYGGRANTLVLVKFIKIGIPLVFINISSYLFSQGNQLVLASMDDLSLLGEYAVCEKFIILSLGISMVLYQNYFPLLSSNEKIREYLKFIFCLSLVLMFAMMLFGPKIVLLLYGQEFEIASTLMPMFGVIFFMSSISTFQGALQLNLNMHNFLLWESIICGMGNVLFSIILVTKYSIYGILFARIFFQFFSVVLPFCSQRYRLKMYDATLAVRNVER